jgi:hypothetical protein
VGRIYDQPQEALPALPASGMLKIPRKLGLRPENGIIIRNNREYCKSPSQ